MPERLSPIEAIMWRVGQDPALHMPVGYVIVLDRQPAPGALAERLEVAVELAPRLRQRPDDAGLAFARPSWVDDPAFHVNRHLRSLAVSAPGDLRQALDAVGLVAAVPLDPSRPPWDVTVIEGLEGGGVVLYLRARTTSSPTVWAACA